MSKQRPTMKDVAELSGHCLSSVDRVLNGRASVRADTAKDILDAAESLGFYAKEVIKERLKNLPPRKTLGFLLQQPDSLFYQELARSIAESIDACKTIRGRVLLEFMTDTTPAGIAKKLLEFANHVDAVALVAAEHPKVSAAIEELHQANLPVFSLITDQTTPNRAGYVGLDNRKVGRTAAWFITQLAPKPGKIALLMGSHRIQCQELCEMSFRSYIREYAPDFEVLDSLITLESSLYAGELMQDLLSRRSDLVGFYVNGSGVEGVLQVLQEMPNSPSLIGVGHEITSATRSGLMEGHLHAVIANDVPKLATQLIHEMAEQLVNPSSGLRHVVVPFDIFTPESI